MTEANSGNKNKLNLSLDLRLVSILLLIVIGIMLALWRPWNAAPAGNARTITVTGESTVKSAPDEFVFTPTYDAKDADKAAASKAVIAKQEEVVAGLKKLGVVGSKIKTDTGGYSNSYLDDTTNLYHYSTNVRVSIDATNKALLQKVQDYLVSTEPTGQLSPQGSFSEPLRNKLESQGRDEATKVARAKAEQSAKNLGFKVGAVKSVNDGSGSVGCLDFCTTDMKGNVEPAIGRGAIQTLRVQPGEDDLSYSVTVVYYVK